MSEKVHQLPPASRIDRRHAKQPGHHQGFFFMLGGNLIVPALASQGLDQESILDRLGGYAIFLCFTSLVLQGLAFVLGRLPRAVQDPDRLADLEAWRRLADRGAVAGLLSRFSMLLAGGLLIAAILIYATTLLWPVVLGPHAS